MDGVPWMIKIKLRKSHNNQVINTKKNQDLVVCLLHGLGKYSLCPEIQGI